MIMKNLFTSSFIVFILSLNTATHAANYFVSPTGNDNNSGIISQPFLTFEKASSLVKAGDTVFVRGGIYSSRQKINGSSDGTSSNPIVFINYPNETPIIDGSSLTLSSNQALLSIVRWTTKPEMKFYEVIGMTIRYSNERGIYFYKVNQLKIKQCLVHDIETRGIGGYGKYVTIEDNEVYNAVLENINNAYGNNGGWAMGISFTYDYQTNEGVIKSTIRNNYVHDCWGEGMAPGSTSNDMLIEGNTVVNCFSVGIYLNKCTNVTVRNNHVYNTDPTYYRFSQPANGIAMANETSFSSLAKPLDSIYIYNNILSHVRKGISFWHDLSNTSTQNSYHNVEIYYNVILNPTSKSVDFDLLPNGNVQPYNCILKNNIFYYGTTQSDIHNPNGWQVSNNNWFGAGGYPSFAGQGAINADQLFVNANNPGNPLNYKLTSSSPCIGKAIATTRVATDYFGNSRVNPSSIGAHDYSASVPLTLIDFQLMKNKNVIDINWTTAFEIDINHFILERSTQNKGWETIYTPLPMGNYHAKAYYSYRDYEAPHELVFYKLSEKTIHGESIEIAQSTINNTLFNSELELFPNPVNDYLYFKNSTEQEQSNILTGKLSIYNSWGKLVLEKTIKNTPLIKINLADIAAGIYTVRIESYTPLAFEKVSKILKY